MATPQEQLQQKVIAACTSLASNVINVCVALPGVPLDTIAFVTLRLLEFGRDQINLLEKNDHIAPEIMRVHRAFVAAEKAWREASESLIQTAAPGALRSMNRAERRNS